MVEMEPTFFLKPELLQDDQRSTDSEDDDGLEEDEVEYESVNSPQNSESQANCTKPQIIRPRNESPDSKKTMSALGKLKPERLWTFKRIMICGTSGTDLREYHLKVHPRVPTTPSSIYSAFVQPNKSLCFGQRRYISQGIYYNYLSPDVPLIGFLIGVLDSVHTFSGMPWWFSIAITTITLRTCLTLPLHIYSIHNRRKGEKVHASLTEMAKQLKGEIKMSSKMPNYRYWDINEEKRQFNVNMKRLTQREFEKHGFHPAKSFVVGFIQVPLWISMSLALRNMCGWINVKGLKLPVFYPDLATEGLLWFPNLLVADSTLILPIVMATSNLLIIEMNALSRVERSKMDKIIFVGLRCAALVMVPIAATVPSCLSFYWACSSLFGLSTNIILRLPSVQRALRMPGLSKKDETPFKSLLNNAKERYNLKSVFKRTKKKVK